MLPAFLYLGLCSARNRVRVRARRLREPRYAIGLFAGCAYLLLVFGRSFLHVSQRSSAESAAAQFLAAHAGGLAVAAACVLLAVAALAWTLPGSSRPALTFSPAEIQFLFPAPATRRSLIHYKILSSQLRAAVGSLILAFVIHAGRMSSGWTFFLGLWLVMVTINLHVTGVSLRRQSLREHGRTGLRHQALPLSVVAGALAVVAAAGAAAWPGLAVLPDMAGWLDVLDRAGHQGVVGLVLAPFIALLALPLAETPAAFAVRLPAALAVAAVNYIWVVRSDAAFEEAAARYAERHMGNGSARPGRPAIRRRGEPFALGTEGRAEVAFLWKNLLQISRYANLRLLVRLAIVVGLVGVLFSRRAEGLAEALASVCTLAAAMVTIFGSQWVRNDLRGDLAHLATLRTWPITSATIVRGEVLAPTVVLASIVWLLILTVAALSTGDIFGIPPWRAGRLSVVGAAIMLAPGVILTQVMTQNAIAALFPAWIASTGARARGVDVMGQRFLLTGVLLFVLIVALVPAAIAAALAAAGVRLFTGVLPIVFPAGVATAVLAIEAAAVSELVGRALDRADVATLPSGQD